MARVLAFDVNETLLDLSSLDSLFEERWTPASWAVVISAVFAKHRTITTSRTREPSRAGRDIEPERSRSGPWRVYDALIA